MPPLSAAVIIVGLLIGVALVGLALRRREGRVSRSSQAQDTRLNPADVGLTRWAPSGTLVQFSTEFCAKCPGVRRGLSTLAGDNPGVVHVEVDLTHDPSRAREFRILSTPTTLVVDPSGAVRARITGVPELSTVQNLLSEITLVPTNA